MKPTLANPFILIISPTSRIIRHVASNECDIERISLRDLDEAHLGVEIDRAGDGDGVVACELAVLGEGVDFRYV